MGFFGIAWMVAILLATIVLFRIYASENEEKECNTSEDTPKSTALSEEMRALTETYKPFKEKEHQKKIERWKNKTLAFIHEQIRFAAYEGNSSIIIYNKNIGIIDFPNYEREDLRREIIDTLRTEGFNVSPYEVYFTIQW